MKLQLAFFSLCILQTSTSLLSAQTTQQAPTSQLPTTSPSISQSIYVTTTVEPLPLVDNNRSVHLLDTQEQPLLLNNVADYLRLDSSVAPQARAGGGVQTDLSLRGTTFEQTLVLVNGFRINDSESGHLNLDLPIPLEAISTIDILHGAGSTFYGSDAIGGSVNLITARPVASSVLTKVGFGSYGAEEQHLAANYVRSFAAEQLSGSRDTSDGFIPDRGYHANALASETWLTTKAGTTDVLLATSDRPYGASQFYGAYDSWERTKAWFASIQQQIGKETAASFGYLRHSDLFVLYNSHPAIYENNHVTTGWEGALRRVDTLSPHTTLSYGLEADGDDINSSNLGHHGRNQGAGYASLSLHTPAWLSLNVGAREEAFSAHSIFSPTIAAAFRLSSSLQLRTTVGHGFRLPTYTDLYYSDPATIGNANLKPESAWSYEGGVDWTSGGRYTFAATGFRLQQKDSIDYSKYALADKWQAINVSDLNLTGVETGMHIRLSASQQLQLSYTAIHAAPPPTGLISEYAFNYAAQNAIFSWTGQIFHQVLASTQVDFVQKTGRITYPLWQTSLVRSSGRIRPYLRLANLANTGYQEIPGVTMQGRSFTGGLAYYWISARD